MFTILRRASIIVHEWKIIKNLTIRNVKIKYKGTWLGFFWVILQPLCTILILYFVFSHFMRIDIEKFPLFLCAGVLPWTFFASSLVEATGSVVTNSNLVLKVNFPLEILPLSYCLSNLFDFIFYIDAGFIFFWHTDTGSLYRISYPHYHISYLFCYRFVVFIECRTCVL